MPEQQPDYEKIRRLEIELLRITDDNGMCLCEANGWTCPACADADVVAREACRGGGDRA
jgi:hypothetical protein